jgi:hypothetical protein
VALYCVDPRCGLLKRSVDRSPFVTLETDAASADAIPAAVRSVADSTTLGNLAGFCDRNVPPGTDGVVTWLAGDAIYRRLGSKYPARLACARAPHLRSRTCALPRGNFSHHDSAAVVSIWPSSRLLELHYSTAKCCTKFAASACCFAGERRVLGKTCQRCARGWYDTRSRRCGTRFLVGTPRTIARHAGCAHSAKSFCLDGPAWRNCKGASISSVGNELLFRIRRAFLPGGSCRSSGAAICPGVAVSLKSEIARKQFSWQRWGKLLPRRVAPGFTCGPRR